MAWNFAGLFPFSPSTAPEEVLVLVDFQMRFQGANDRPTFLAVEREVLRAVSLNLPVVQLMYYNSGDLHPFSERALAGYPRRAMRWKDERDGSLLVLEACDKAGFVPSAFRIVGVNTNQCVQATVEGLVLHTNLPITVVRDACHDYNGNNWSPFVNLPGVALVG